MTRKRRLSTIAIHGEESRQGPVSPPIYHTSTYVFPDSDAVEGYMVRGERKHYMYQRYGNPAQDLLEKRFALIEGAEDSAFFASGMAAITTAVLSVLKEGEEVITIPALYGQTFNFFNNELPKYRMSARFVPIDHLYNLKSIVNRNTKLIYFESPTNPNLQVVDIARVAAQAKALGIKTMIDSTFASPINQNPLALGVDSVIHSATKYIGGHHDVLAGVIAGSKEYIEQCKLRALVYGPTIDPFNVFLILRSLATLEIRVKRQNETAMKLAEYLETHPKVAAVHFPGLPDNPYYEVAHRQMRGFGGMVTIEVKGGKPEAMKVVDSFEIILNATSLGGTHTLASIPVITSHVWLTSEQLTDAHISPGMIRISIGLEDADDLIEDLDQALNTI